MQIFIFLSLIACGDAPVKSEAALKEAGYTEIKLHGPSLVGCGNDNYNTRFTAKSPNGTYADGNVCCGIFKGCTIRL